MRVGYVRCSTVEQNEARQLKMMEDQKVEKIFIDKASGKNADRKDFKAMMAFVRAGDTVIVELPGRKRAAGAVTQKQALFFRDKDQRCIIRMR